MPCRYDPSPEEERQAREKATKKTVAPYIKKLDLLTKLLCEAMRIVAHNQHFTLVDETPAVTTDASEVERRIIPHPVLSNELQAWWKKHQAEDDKRQKEELRTSALAKLTSDERKALGL